MTPSKSKQAADTLAPGSRFGRYRVVRMIGRGGMGAVYEAVHTDLKKRVAIKTLHPRVAEAEEVRARFQREGESAARIQHPNVVDIYDVGTAAGRPYLVMEYLEGHDLGWHLKDRGRFSPTDIADVLLPVICALDVAHGRGVIHRDLKPSNIFLAQSALGGGAPKVVDFGISKIVGDSGLDGLTATGAVLGTPYYMSPEQAHGGKLVDERSDQYSLGVILYQCVTGERPFMADSMYQILHKIVEGQFASPRALHADLPEPLEAIIMRAMAREPEHRFTSLLEMGQDLLPFARPRTQALLEPILGKVPPPPALTIEPSTAPVLFREPSVPPTLEGTGDALVAPSSHLPVAIGLALAVVLGVGSYLYALRSPVVEALVVTVPSEAASANPPRLAAPALGDEKYSVELRTIPASAEIMLDGQEVGIGIFEAQLAKDGVVHELRVRAKGYAPYEMSFTDVSPPGLVTLSALPSAEVTTTKPAVRRPVRRPARRPTKTRQAEAAASVPAKADQPKRGTNEALILR